MRLAANVFVRTGKTRWLDITQLVRHIDAPPGQCQLTLDAAGVRRRGLDRAIQRATTRWRVVWAHTAAGELEGDSYISTWRDGALIVTLAGVETRSYV